MFMSFISWWYGKGWSWRAEKIIDGIERSIDTFSLGLLVKTWFSPFRQIDAGVAQGGSLDVRFRRALDRLFSRFIGAFLRTIVMIIGVFYISIKAIWGMVMLVLWALMPIAPIILFIIFSIGWSPKILPKIKDGLQKSKTTNTTINAPITKIKKGFLK